MTSTAAPAPTASGPTLSGPTASGPTTSGPTAATAGDRFPLAALLVMALTGFVLLATETMQAGLLPQIAYGLSTTESTAGQLITAYALGTVVATLPAVAWTRGMRRKPVLLTAVLGFLAADTLVVVSHDTALSLVARFVAGAFSGLLWGMLAGYAHRITAPDRAGRALAIASIGNPLGLAVGTPLGSWLGTAFGWRWSFGALLVLTAVAFVLAATLVPDAPGQPAGSHLPLLRVLATPGVAPVLVIISTWMIGHNVEYTYLSPYLRAAGVQLPVDLALVIFGVAALVGLAITGVAVDRALRRLVFASIGSFIAAGVVFVVGQQSPVAVLAAIVLWGLAYGGAATQLQTAIAEASGENTDVANSMLGVAFNLAIFAAGVLGAVLISTYDGLALPVVMIVLAAVALVIALTARVTALPTRQ